MQIELPQNTIHIVSGAPSGQDVSVSVPKNVADALPQVGESVKAKVLFSDGETANLKLESGMVLKARIESGVLLKAGEDVLLTVEQKQDSFVSMRIEGRAGVDQSPLTPELAPYEGDPARLELAQALHTLKLPLSEEAVARLEQVLSRYPDMPLDKAAFLAASGMVSESSSPADWEAAKNLILKTVNTGELLSQLLAQATLSEEGAAPMMSEELAPPPPVPPTPAQGEEGAKPPLSTHDLLKALDEAIAGLRQSEGAEVQPLPAPVQKGEWDAFVAHLYAMVKDGESPLHASGSAQGAQGAQSAELLQAPDSGAAPEAALTSPAITEGAQAAAPAPEGPAVLPAAPESLLPEQAEGAPAALAPADVKAGAEGAQVAAASAESDVPKAAPLPSGAAPHAAPAAPSERELEQTVYSMLKSMPAFDAVQDKGIRKLAQSLSAVTKDFSEVQDKEDIVKLLDKMLFKEDREGVSQKEQLRQAKDELYFRLSFLKQAVLQSNLSAKESIASTADRLLNHVKLLNNIEQFAYLQIPFLPDKKEQAELYIFRQKKGQKKIDPENIKILLALDTENMGRLESLIHVKGREINLNLEVENDDIVQYIKENTRGLYLALEGTGFKLSDISVGRLKKETFLEDAMAVLDRFEQSMHQGFDLII